MECINKVIVSLSPILSQDSAKKLEQNVAHFGSTVENLLYRYGKVHYSLDLFHILSLQPEFKIDERKTILPHLHIIPHNDKVKMCFWTFQMY